MRKSLSCREMGVESCSFEVLSERNDEIKDALFAHVTKVHPEKVRNLTKEQQNEMSKLMDKKLTI
jgi:predicted small metal-binding protein